jgi:Flp pilus assembly protein CpaB
VVAVATAAIVGHLATGAAAARDRWGPRRATLVITRDVDAGRPIDARDSEVRLLPSALVPHDALRSRPARALAAVDLRAGETVLPSRLAGYGRSVVTTRLPRGTRGVAVPAGTGLPLAVGDRVDVLATFDKAAAVDGAPTFPVATDALIVHVDRDAVTVAVAARDAARVAYALTTGAVTLVLRA